MLNASLMLALANTDLTDDVVFARIHAAACNGDLCVRFDSLSQPAMDALREAAYTLSPGSDGVLVSWG